MFKKYFASKWFRQSRDLVRDDTGFISLEVGLALGLLASASVLYLEDEHRKKQDSRYTTEAELARFMANSMANYVYSDRFDLETTLQSGPLTITVAMMTAQGTLPGGFSNTTQFGKSYYGVVRRVGPFIFRYLTCATGGTVLRDSQLQNIARGMGQFGGGVYTSDSSNLRVNSGVYVEAVANYTGAATIPSAGDYCTLGFFGKEELIPDYVSKSKTTGGAADMAVRLDMSGNDIQQVAALRFGAQTPAQGLNETKTDTLTGLSASHAPGTAATVSTADTLALRDANGRMQAEAPADPKDVVNLETLQAAAGGSGGPTWEVYTNNLAANHWASSGGGTTHEMTKGIAGDKVINCFVHSTSALGWHNTGSHYSVYVQIQVYDSANAFVGTVTANHLLASVATRSYAMSTSNGFHFTGLSFPDGSWLRIYFSGSGSIGATADCSYKVL